MIDEPLEAPSVSCEELMEMCMRVGGMWCEDYDALCGEDV
ncbi:hypothetical protein PFV2_gp04 [Pyrobaculum filamentous virus 2]|uniref:Uncharacterized protein n=1 Tax=Pyrobaculum filamentous virus 2 TaxID=2730621 RepID=A0A6M3VXN2_PFV2|nr:hypothetical protein QIT34_gp04 [Pyrobaculum filamentous virus 2]QJF12377.1 hypothetical protein PFV2_gp04 [Pyrobaculum filamentous virus 2]